MLFRNAYKLIPGVSGAPVPPPVFPVAGLLRGASRKLRFAIGLTIVFPMTPTVTPSPMTSTMTVRGTLAFHRAAPPIQSIEELA